MHEPIFSRRRSPTSWPLAPGGSGTKQELFACNGGTNQEWTHLSTDQYQIKSNTTLCLNDPADSTTDGTQQIIYACSQNGVNEHWSVPG